MNSYLEKIEEKRKRIKELEEQKERIITGEDSVRLLKKGMEIELEILSNNIGITELVNKKEGYKENQRKKEDQSSISFCLSLLFIVVTTAIFEIIFFKFNPTYFFPRMIAYTLISLGESLGLYLKRTKELRKSLKNVNFDALEHELIEKWKYGKELERKLSGIKYEIDLFKRTNYYSIEEKIRKLSNEIEELDALRKTAIEDILDDILEQQERVDKDFSELSPELQDVFMTALLKEIEIGKGRPFRTKIKIPNNAVNSNRR